MPITQDKTDSTEVSRAQGYFVQLQPSDTDGEISLIELFRILGAYWKMVFATIFALTSVAIVISLVMTPIYRSVVLMTPVSVDGRQGGLASLAGQLGLGSLAGLGAGSASQAEEAVAILKSRAFTKRFIDDENLFPILFSDDWDSEENRWDVDDSDSIPTDEDAYRLFNDEIRAVNSVKRTDMFALSIEWSDRELAALWANKLVSKLNDYLRIRDIEEAERSIEFLNKELEKNTSVELRQGISSLIEHQIEIKMLANVRDQYAFKVLDAAVVADADKRVRPKRKVIVISTFLVASIFAAFLALIRFQFDMSSTIEKQGSTTGS